MVSHYIGYLSKKRFLLPMRVLGMKVRANVSNLDKKQFFWELLAFNGKIE